MDRLCVEAGRGGAGSIEEKSLQSVRNYSSASLGGGALVNLSFNRSAFFWSEFSHIIRSTAISQVSRTTVGSFLSSLINLMISKLRWV